MVGVLGPTVAVLACRIRRSVQRPGLQHPLVKYGDTIGFLALRSSSSRPLGTRCGSSDGFIARPQFRPDCDAWTAHPLLVTVPQVFGLDVGLEKYTCAPPALVF